MKWNVIVQRAIKVISSQGKHLHFTVISAIKETRFSTGSDPLKSRKKMSQFIHKFKLPPLTNEIIITDIISKIPKQNENRKKKKEITASQRKIVIAKRKSKANLEVFWSTTWPKPTCSVMVTLWPNTRSQKVLGRYRIFYLNNLFCMVWVERRWITQTKTVFCQNL